MSDGDRPGRDAPDATRRLAETQADIPAPGAGLDPTLPPSTVTWGILDATPSPGAGSARTTSEGGARPAPGGAADLDDFSLALVEIGLTDADELSAFAADSAEGVLGLSRALVKAGKLTAYQAAAVYQKKSRGLLIGNYLILDKLGQGGMGVVFKARHRQSGRVGALKILPPSFARDKSAVLRFRREVEAAGRLRHPNLVAAQDADEDRGVHFLVMDYVAGRDLDRVVGERGPMPVVQAIDCLIQAARGLEAAHAQGIVHRDIKPGNLMLDAAGAVRVLDLGLARIADAANPFSKTAAGRLTQTGMFMGTINFMAPEQAEDSHRADHRADIYSLGCTLYYLLTGREPFPGETILKRLNAHAEQPAPSLCSARTAVPASLDAVYQKMMAKRPDDRPASMTEVIAHLEACKAATEALTVIGESPRSRPELKVFNEVPLGSTDLPKARRDPSPSLPRGVAEVLPTDRELSLEDLGMDVRPEGGPGASSLRPVAAGAPAPPARRATASPFRGWPRRTGLIVGSLGATAMLVAVIARFALVTGPPRDLVSGSTDLANVLEAAEESRPAPPESIPPPPPSTDVTRPPPADIAGPKTADIAGPKPVVPSTSEPESYVETARFVGHLDPWVESVRVLPDGKRMLTTTTIPDGERVAILWDIESGRELHRLWHPERLRPVAVFADGRRAVTGCADGVVRLWDLQTGRLIRDLAKHLAGSSAVAVLPDGRFAISGGDDKVLRLSDVQTGTELRAFKGFGASIVSLAVSPDGRRFLAGTTNGTVWLGGMEGDPTVQPLNPTVQPLKGHSDGTFIWDVDFTGDGRHGVSGGDDGQLIYWDLGARRERNRTRVDGCHIRALAVTPDGRHVIFGTQDNRGPQSQGMIGFWDITTDVYRPGPRGVAHLGLDFLPDGSIVTSDVDGLARIWRPEPALARARNLVEAARPSDALAEYARLVAERPGDARLLIERGRLLAELGRSSEADADFTRAAALAPGNPQLFLDDGWWVAGTYPPDLNAPAALASDPSEPPPTAPDGPRRWQRAPIERAGCVNLGRLFPEDHIGAYAMAIVYAASRQDVVLLTGVDDRARFWLNGRPVDEIPRATNGDAHAVIVTLQPGRNTILAKVVDDMSDYLVYLRFSDAPRDFYRAYLAAKQWDRAAEAYKRTLARDPSDGDRRMYEFAAEAYAGAGRWKEAVAAFEKLVALDPRNEAALERLLKCYFAVNDLPSYRRLCPRLIDKHIKDGNPTVRNNAIWLAALIPDALPSYREVLASGNSLLNRKDAGFVYFNTYGALLYRAGRYPGAVTYLNKSIEAQKGQGHALDWVFLAMALHRQGQPGDRAALDRARVLAKQTTDPWQRVEIDALLEEARRELAPPAGS